MKRLVIWKAGLSVASGSFVKPRQQDSRRERGLVMVFFLETKPNLCSALDGRRALTV